MKRRRFLQHAASGCAVISMPAVLSGCNLNTALQRPSAASTMPGLDTFGVDERTLRRCVSLLSGGPADLADVFFQYRNQHRINFINGNMTDVRVDVSRGAGLRSVAGSRVGFAVTEDLTPEALLATAARAATEQAEASADPVRLVETTPNDLYRITIPWSDIELAPKRTALEKLERMIRESEASVTSVAIRWVDQDEHVLIVTEEGRLVFDLRPMVQLSVTVSAEHGGVVHTGFASSAARHGLEWLTDERLQALADTAVERTRNLFEAIRPPEGDMPVILAAGASGVLLHETIGHCFEADFVQAGTSPFANRMGTVVAKDFVNIVDQGELPHARGALNVDDEGVMPGRQSLVEQGRISGWLHDRTTARSMGQAPTGSGRRASYRDLPLPRMSCTYVENGPHSLDEMLGSVERGILCETYSGGQVTPGAGDFRFTVRNGWLIENGQRVAPITGVDLVGNGPDMLANITMLGNDRQMDPGGWTCGKHGQQVPVSEGMPTALVSALQVLLSAR